MHRPAILLIEDDPILAQLYTQLLAEVCKNGQVIHVTTAAAALSYICQTKQQPQLILTDMILPDMSGLTLLPTLSAHTNAPIVVLSNLDDSIVQAECLRSGAAGYYIKSECNPEQFLTTVRKHINFLHP